MNIAEISSDKDKCCGCNACVMICPVNAIRMVSERGGHYYPSIDLEKCKDCSLCLSVCSGYVSVKKLLPFKTIAATYRNGEVSAKSSSGGVFAALAESVITDGGVVYGTCFTEKFDAVVIGIESLSDLHRIQGSKYVHSEMGQVYKDIETQLENGRRVLFSGVPCQIAALKTYLNREVDNLVLVDIVCHGTPSNRMFRDYLDFYQKKRRITIIDFVFRDKRYGQDHRGKYTYCSGRKGGKEIRESHFRPISSSYYKLFLNCATMRMSCYSCQFASPERVGDISLCDYWGVNDYHPDFVKMIRKERLSGISAVMVNTSKGEKCLDVLKDRLIQIPTDYTNVRKNNPQLNMPSKKPVYYDDIMTLYENAGYQAVDKYYFKKFKKVIIRSYLGRAIPGKMRKRLLLLKRRVLG